MNNNPSGSEVVVIGSGAAGLAAALTAAEGGARVVVFEKERTLGGTSNFFEGTFAVESAMQRERYITYSRDEAFKSLMEYSHWRANPRLVRLLDESAATIACCKNKAWNLSMPLSICRILPDLSYH
jgi:fumarate reductase flavoprotein subunit